jgi:hypothetical protein
VSATDQKLCLTLSLSAAIWCNIGLRSLAQHIHAAIAQDLVSRVQVAVITAPNLGTGRAKTQLSLKVVRDAIGFNIQLSMHARRSVHLQRTLLLDLTCVSGYWRKPLTHRPNESLQTFLKIANHSTTPIVIKIKTTSPDNYRVRSVVKQAVALARVPLASWLCWIMAAGIAMYVGAGAHACGMWFGQQTKDDLLNSISQSRNTWAQTDIHSTNDVLVTSSEIGMYGIDSNLSMSSKHLTAVNYCGCHLRFISQLSSNI